MRALRKQIVSMRRCIGITALRCYHVSELAGRKGFLMSDYYEMGRQQSKTFVQNTMLRDAILNAKDGTKMLIINGNGADKVIEIKDKTNDQ